MKDGYWASAYRLTICRGSARRKMDHVQVSPQPRRILNQDNRTALRRHRGALVETQPKLLGCLVGFGGTSMCDGEVRNNALMFACVRLKVGEGFGYRSRHSDERRSQDPRAAVRAPNAPDQGMRASVPAPRGPTGASDSRVFPSVAYQPPHSRYGHVCMHRGH